MRAPQLVCRTFLPECVSQHHIWGVLAVAIVTEARTVQGGPLKQYSPRTVAGCRLAPQQCREEADNQLQSSCY